MRCEAKISRNVEPLLLRNYMRKYVGHTHTQTSTAHNVQRPKGHNRGEEGKDNETNARQCMRKETESLELRFALEIG